VLSVGGGLAGIVNGQAGAAAKKTKKSQLVSFLRNGSLVAVQAQLARACPNNSQLWLTSGQDFLANFG
jgi:hypothetical protein